MLHDSPVEFLTVFPIHAMVLLWVNQESSWCVRLRLGRVTQPGTNLTTAVEGTAVIRRDARLASFCFPLVVVMAVMMVLLIVTRWQLWSYRMLVNYFHVCQSGRVFKPLKLSVN